MKYNNFNFNQIFLNTLDSRALEPLLAFLHLDHINANISEKSLSILLAKASFAFLLISMFSYWFQMSFKSEILMKFAPTRRYFSQQRTLQRSLALEDPSEQHNVGDLIIDRKNFLARVPLISMWAANITLALLLSIRWIESGHFPLSNLYESLIFLSWSLTVIHLFLENLFHKREQILCNVKQEILATNLTLGAITSPVALFTNAFATFSLPQEMQKVTVLVPALKSNWLIMHVSVMIISYAALLSGSLLAMAFLVFKFMHDNKIHSIRYTFLNYVSSLTQLISRGSNAYVKQRRSKERFDTVALPLPRSASMRRTLPRIPRRGKASTWSEEKGKLLFMGTRNKKGFLKCEIEEGSDAHGLTSSLPLSGYALNPPPFRVLVAKRQTLRGMRERVPYALEDLGSMRSSSFATPRESNIPSGQRSVEDPYGVNSNRFATLQGQQQLDLPQILDNLSYRCISLGFALLTIGILSGAVWANEAWGSYWSWDPKETWAFITWLVFALYLHTRLSKGWVGKESAFVASFGFLVIWFCYLGVNLFGKGLHSYGWFQQ